MTIDAIVASMASLFAGGFFFVLMLYIDARATLREMAEMPRDHYLRFRADLRERFNLPAE